MAAIPAHSANPPCPGSPPRHTRAAAGDRAGLDWPGAAAHAVVLETGGAAVLAATATGGLAAAGLWAAAAALAAAGLVRWRGRWLGAWALVWLRFVRGGPAAEPIGRELAAVDDSGAVALVVGDAVVTAVAVEPAGPLRRVERAAPLDVARLAGSALRAGEVERAELQVVQAVQPVPAGRQTPAARSYLLLRGSRVPASVRTYVALRVDRADDPVAVASRGGGATGAAHALRRPLRRLLAELPRQGLSARLVTDPTEMLEACGGAAGAEPSEVWDHSRAAGRIHVCFAVRRRGPRWSAGGRDRIAALLGGLPGELAVHSASIRRERETVTCRDVFRVAGRTQPEADDAAAALAARAAAAGLSLRRLDGEHRLALRASLPAGRHGAGPRLRPSRVEAGRPDGLLLAPGGGGLLLGSDQAGSALAACLFTPEPMSVCLIGGPDVAGVLAFRATALGAHVVVETQRPAAWRRLAHAATDAAVLVPAGSGPTGPANAASPRLCICDLGSAPPPRSAARWQTRLTLLPSLRPEAGDTVAQAQLLGVGRLAADDLEILRRLGELPDEVSAALPTLRADEVYWADSTGFVRSRLTPTSIERALLAPTCRPMDPGRRLRSLTSRD